VSTAGVRQERTDERGLVRRMLAGEEPAFEEFAADYLPPLLRFASRRLGGDRELARDIVQSTVCKAIGKLATFRGESALMTWLCACCQNEIAAHFRRAQRLEREVDLERVEESALSAALPPAAGGPESAILQAETHEVVHAVLDLLPPRYAQALEWKYLEDLPVRDIAARLSLGEKAAESLLTRARQAFRDGFERLARAARPASVDVRFLAPRMELES
jgi:RNA polymerase sigma-70 factor (ECF subfamily)